MRALRHSIRIFCVSVILATTVSAAPHEDAGPLTLLKLYPAEGNYLSSDSKETAIAMLKWQIERDESLAEKLENQLQEMADGITLRTRENNEIRRHEMGRFAALSDEERSRLAGQVVERVLALEVDVAARQRMEEAEAQATAETNELRELDLAKLEVERQALAVKLETLTKKKAELMELRKNGYAPKSELAAAEASVKSIKFELDKLELDRVAATRAVKAEIAKRLSRLRTQRAAEQAQLKLAEKQLAEIAAANRAAFDFEVLALQLERKRSVYRAYGAKLDELRLQVEEAKAFLELLQEKRRKSPQDNSEGPETK